MAAAVMSHDRPASDRIGHLVAMAARNHGVIVRPLGDSIIFMPPLSMSVQEIAQVGQAVGRAILDVLGR